MTARETDYGTYPGDRPTRLTRAQQDRKVAAALAKIEEARQLLREVCDDYSANYYRLSHADQERQRRAVELISPLERILRDERDRRAFGA